MQNNIPVIAETLAVPTVVSDQKMAYDSGPNYSQYLKAFKKHFGLIVTVVLCGILLGFLVNQLFDKKYTAAATIKIDAEPVQILDYGLDTHQKKSMINNTIFFQTQYKLLRSRKLAGNVIQKLSLEDSLRNQSEFSPEVVRLTDNTKQYFVGLIEEIIPSEKKTVVEERLEDIFLQNLTIKPLKDSQVVEVIYRSSDAQHSADVVNGFVEHFVAHREELHKAYADKAAAFLRSELFSARNRLQKSEEELLDYAKKKNIIDTKGDRSIIAQSLEDLSGAYIKAKQQRIIAASVYAKQRRASGELYASDSEVIGRLKGSLAEVSARYKEDLKTYKPEYPGMVALQAQIQDLKNRINIETQKAKRSVESDLQAALLSAQQQEQQLNREILSYEKKLLNFEDKNLLYTNLQREAETNRVHYEGLLQRLKEVTVAGSSANESIDIIDDAYPPAKASNISAAVSMILGAIVGVFAAILLALYKSLTDTKVHSLEDLQHLGLPYPVLSALPKVKKPNKLGLPLLAATRPNSAMAESIRYLYANLAMNNNREIPRQLLVTSSLPGEGKSSTVLNLASMLSKTGKRVLIIDGDLRKPTVHHHLHVNNDEGLGTYLSGHSKKLPLKKVKCRYPLFVIPAGPMVSDPVSLLSQQKMIDMCSILRDKFDHIIIDSPPVLGMADALVLSNRTDATLFIVSSDKATKTNIESALRNLEKGFANIVGMVFSHENNKKGNQYYQKNHYTDNRPSIAQVASIM